MVGCGVGNLAGHGCYVELAAHVVLVGTALRGELYELCHIATRAQAQTSEVNLCGYGLGGGVDDFQDERAAGLVDGGIGVDGLTLGERELVNELSVEQTACAGAIDLNLNIVPAAIFQCAACGSKGVLRAVGHQFHGMLSVAPATEVPPDEVLAVLGSEDDDEALVAFEATGLQRETVAVAKVGIVKQYGAFGTSAVLTDKLWTRTKR